jgi:3-keto-5-aminohexanoate cleavage enzyme
MTCCSVKPEYEAFDTGHITNAIYLTNKYHLPRPMSMGVAMGAPGCQQASYDQLSYLLHMMPPQTTFNYVHLGGPKQQRRFNAAAMAMGVHIRVGLEDCIFNEQGKISRWGVGGYE